VRELTNLKRVTITGADDSTSISELVGLSSEFPFVELGILVSKGQEGSHRFPSHRWIDEFSDAASRAKLAVCTHLCGAWVRSLLTNELDWHEVPACLAVSQRVQINTHAGRYASTVGMIDSLRRHPSKEFIFQWEGINNHLAYAALAYGCKVAALFDLSGGAGTLPSHWPPPVEDFWCGYAGGLGPDNVIQQVHEIDSVCKQPYWIDMERRVRTPDDSTLDMRAVRQVLEAVAAIL
jgi:hypothetical protein